MLIRYLRGCKKSPLKKKSIIDIDADDGIYVYGNVSLKNKFYEKYPEYNGKISAKS
jgi:hypothetical protein